MIRPVTPLDMLTLRRKPRSTVMLYNEMMLAAPHRAFWFALRCAAEGGGREGITLISHERGTHAMLQATGRRGRPEQDVVMLTSYGGGRGTPTDPDLWFRLLEQLVASAPRFRVQRQFAALSQRHEELREVFRQIGFAPYTQQLVLRLDGPDWDQGTTIAAMRPQSRRDVWAIHKLYGAVTPPPVQHAEAHSARDWMLPMSGLNRPVRRGWVLGSDDNLSAYLHLTSGPTAHVLSLLIRPDDRGATPDALRFALGQINDSLPVYLMLRAYQQDLLATAGDLGFQPIGEQALLSRQSTAAVRNSLLLPGIESAIEPRPSIPTPFSSMREDFLWQPKTILPATSTSSSPPSLPPSDSP